MTFIITSTTTNLAKLHKTNKPIKNKIKVHTLYTQQNLTHYMPQYYFSFIKKNKIKIQNINTNNKSKILHSLVHVAYNKA